MPWIKENEMEFKFKKHDIVKILPYKDDKFNKEGLVTYVTEKDGKEKVHVSNSNMPYCGCVNAFFDPEQLELLIRHQSPEEKKATLKKDISEIKKMMINATLYDQSASSSKIEEWKKGQFKFTGQFKVSGIYLQMIWDFLTQLERK